MFDPISATMAVGAAVGIGSNLWQGQQQAEELEYNAKLSEREARLSKEKAGYEADKHREAVKKILSTQRALYGASGMDISGSAQLVMEDTAKEGEMDARAILYGGDIDAARKRSEANLYRMRKRATTTASYFGAGSSLLTGGANIYNASPLSVKRMEY